MRQSLWMLVAAFFYACMSALVKQCSVEVGTFEIVFFRALLTLIFVYAIMRMEHVGVATQYLGRHLCRSICGAVAFTLWFASMGHLPLGTAVTLSYTGPIFIALTTLVLCLIHGKKFPWLLVAAIFLGFLGICIMMHPTLNPGAFGWTLMALCTGLFAPIIFMTIQRLGQLGEPSSRIVFYFMLVSTIWGAAGMLLLEGGLHEHSTSIWVMLFGVGICSTLAQLFMTRAYAKGNLLVSACFHFATIPFAELFSVFVFRESLSPDTLVGMGLILTAGVIATVSSKSKHRHH